MVNKHFWGENEYKPNILGRFDPDDGHWMQIISVILQHQSSPPRTGEEYIATSNAFVTSILLSH